MPQFASPWSLLLLLAIPPLAAWWLLCRRRTLRLPAADQFRTLSSLRSWAATWGGTLLRCLGLVLLALALSGPRWPDLRTRIETEGIAIQMLVDVSGSMAEPDFDWNGENITRLDAVKRVFRLFVEGDGTLTGTADGTNASSFEGRPTDEIGLITFATRPETACPLTLSHSVLLRLLDNEQPRRVPTESETNISDAIILGLHRLKSVGARRKVIVLLTDGEHNVTQPRSGWSPLQAAQIATSLQVPIYTLDAGTTATPTVREGPKTENTASAGEIRAAAVLTLGEIARLTGGKAFEVRDTDGLLEACRTIDRLERSDFRSFQYRRYHEGYPWLALAALACWVLVQGLEMTIWRRLP
jgi:Ca-activated chloride channel homolog